MIAPTSWAVPAPGHVLSLAGRLSHAVLGPAGPCIWNRATTRMQGRPCPASANDPSSRGGHVRRIVRFRPGFHCRGLGRAKAHAAPVGCIYRRRAPASPSRRSAARTPAAAARGFRDCVRPPSRERRERRRPDYRRAAISSSPRAARCAARLPRLPRRRSKRSAARTPASGAFIRGLLQRMNEAFGKTDAAAFGNLCGVRRPSGRT